jgi:hypothetical protein
VKKLIIICLSLLLSGCNSNVQTARQNSNLQIAQDVAQEIINTFIERDEEALYLLLSQAAKDFEKTREQIQEAFDFIDGEIVSYELPNDTGGGGKSVEDGIITTENISPRIYNIISCSEKRYRIWFQYYLINEGNRNMEGLDRISVSLVDEKDKIIESVIIDWFQRLH